MLSPLAITALISMTTAMAAIAPVGHAQAAEAMSVEDFKLDQTKLQGVVTIKGKVGCMDQMCFLHGENSMTSVLFDPSRLARENRKRLMTCDSFADYCEATVTATVKHAATDPTHFSADMLSPIVATGITWTPTAEDLAARDPMLPPCTDISTGAVKQMLERAMKGAPLAQIMHITIDDVKVTSTEDAQGYRHCFAKATTSAGEKAATVYYIKRDGQLYITGRWMI